MKKIIYSLATLLFISVVFSSHADAQQTSSVSKNKYEDEGSWKAAKINATGTNIINGVEFYKKSMSAATKSVAILKVVNTNLYSVKIQWEESAGVKKEIIVPANTTVEGNADTADENSNESKLVFPGKLSDEAKQLMHSTISVTKVE